MVVVDRLFLDMNAFFASAEQQLRPELRGLPVVIAPMKTDRTCCIAASYEARPYGIKTGTNIGEARRRCPGLRVVEARHREYVALHEQIVESVETVLPVDKVCSIDEMVCRLDPRHRPVPEALRVAHSVKQAIAHGPGECLRCSIGLAPNHFLAKVASNMQKPNGLTVITREQLPRRLYGMQLDDLPGIARNMRKRLASRGVRNMRQLCALSKSDLVSVWGSIVGAMWWHWLRGDDYATPDTHRQTVGHSHVLPPALRTDDGVRAVLVRLLHKAAARLRRLGYMARRLDVSVGYVGDWPKWRARAGLGRCQDTPTMLRALDVMWHARPPGGKPIKASVRLSRLDLAEGVSLSLFMEDRQALRAAQTLDAVNARFGANAMYFASMHDTRRAAPMRIAFTHIPDIEAEQEG